MDKKNKKLNVEVFDYSTIPKFMQEHGRFCLWKLVMKPEKISRIRYHIALTVNEPVLLIHNTIHLLKKLWRHFLKAAMQVSVSAALNHLGL